MFITRNRAIAAATAVAIALTSTVFTSATAEAGYRARHYARGNQAFAGMVMGIIGAVATYAAAREYRKAHTRCVPGYGCEPAPYGSAPYGYHGPYGYYGPPAPYGYYRY